MGVALALRIAYEPWFLNYDARYALVWADLVIVPKSGTAIRLRPLGPTDAEHAESLIKRQLEKLQS